MRRARTIVQRTLLLSAAVVALDVGMSLTWLRDGRVGKRPLPPFGVELDAEQREALVRLESGEIDDHVVTWFDRELGWTLRPGAIHASGDFHVNARGLRGLKEYSELPRSNVQRLACFGDSFTFGDEVPDRATFEAILEERARSVEALNFGVPAYGSDQALLRMRKEGIAGARVVVLGLLLENIGRNVNRFRPLWMPRTLSPLAKPRFVLVDGRLELVPQPYGTPAELARAIRDGSVLGRLSEHEYWQGRPEVWTGRWSALGRLAAGWSAYRERDPRRLWLDEAGEPRRTTLALVEAFRAEALALGAEEFLLLVFPMRQEFEVFAESREAYWDAALAELRAREIECIDLAPALAARQRALDQDPALGTLYVASHLSSVGNEIVAREIESWLREKTLLPPKLESR